jgi:4-carboxymuconolactone decarboxylase
VTIDETARLLMTNSSHPVSRLAGASESSGDSLLSELYARIRAQRGRILNIHQVVGHAPKLLRAQAAYAASMREDSSLPRDLQELLILRIAQVNDSAYEQSVHRPIAIRVGAAPAKIDALASWRDAPLFDARERAALGYVEQASRTGDVDDTTFAATRQVFSPQEIVELTALVAWYVGNSRFVRALRIAVEDGES